MFGTSWAALRQSLADTMDRALDTYWGTMREADPDVMLLASQNEVLAPPSRRLHSEMQACLRLMLAACSALHCLSGNTTGVLRPANPRMLKDCWVLCAAPVADVHLHGDCRHHGAQSPIFMMLTPPRLDVGSGTPTSMPWKCIGRASRAIGCLQHEGSRPYGRHGFYIVRTLL